MKDTLSWQECALLLSNQILCGCYDKSVEFIALVKQVGFEYAYEFVTRESWPYQRWGNAGPILGSTHWRRVDVLYLVRRLCQRADDSTDHLVNFYEMQGSSARSQDYLALYPAEKIVSMGKKALLVWGKHRVYLVDMGIDTTMNSRDFFRPTR